MDFAGHGTTAALNTFRLHTLIHELQVVLPDPARLLTELNIRLTELLPVGTFATMLYGVIDVHAKCVNYATAGAPPPFIKASADQPLISAASSGLPLGIDADAEYAAFSVPFGPGGTVVLYSDMLTDFMDENGQRAEEGAALQHVQACVGAPTAGEIVERICIPFLGEGAVPLTDDLTVVCLRYPAAIH